MAKKQRSRRPDKDLFDILKIPRGCKGELPGEFRISKPAFYRALNEDRLLDLDRLLKFHAFLRSKELDCKEVEEEIRVRHPEFSEALGVQLFGLGDRTEFDEMWIFSNQPREMTDPSFRQESMLSHYESVEERLVYFVPDESTGGDLLRVISKTTTTVKEVYIVSSAVVRMMPHTVIFFQFSDHNSVPTTQTLVATSQRTFIYVPEDYSDRIISTLATAGLLEGNSKFRWPIGSNTVCVPSKQISFTLTYPGVLAHGDSRATGRGRDAS